MDNPTPVVITSKELWTAATSVFLPLIIAVIQQRHWSTQVRTLAAFALVFLWSVVGAVYVGTDLPTGTDWRPFVTLLLTNLIGTYATYGHFWKPLGVTQWIEDRTQIGGRP